MGLKLPEWLELFQHATAEPYGFMYLNSKFDKGHRVWKNFDTEMHYVTSEVKPKMVEETENKI
ncbi:MAG: hypothetical protein WC121_13920 [Candidatus Kapaibacterium sp.]|jgi:hypothetical protein